MQEELFIIGFGYLSSFVGLSLHHVSLQSVNRAKFYHNALSTMTKALINILVLASVMKPQSFKKVEISSRTLQWDTENSTMAAFYICVVFPTEKNLLAHMFLWKPIFLCVLS